MIWENFWLARVHFNKSLRGLAPARTSSVPNNTSFGMDTRLGTQVKDGRIVRNNRNSRQNRNDRDVRLRKRIRVEVAPKPRVGWSNATGYGGRWKRTFCFGPRRSRHKLRKNKQTTTTMHRHSRRNRVNSGETAAIAAHNYITNTHCHNNSKRVS